MKKCFMKIHFTRFSLKKCYVLQQNFCCEIKVATWLQTSSINYSKQIFKIQKYQNEAEWKDFWFQTAAHLEISMHCWKKQLFFDKKTIFFVETQKQNPT